MSDFTHSARQTGLVMVRGHAKSLDEKLDGFVNAVLVIEAEAAHVQRICICRIHPKDVTEWKETLQIQF